MIIGCMVGTWFQVGHWQNGMTLFEHALQGDGRQRIGTQQSRDCPEGTGKTGGGNRHYRGSVTDRSRYARAHSNLGIALMEQGRRDEAIRHCEEAMRINPASAKAHNNLGFDCWIEGKTKEGHRALPGGAADQPGTGSHAQQSRQCPDGGRKTG